MRLRGGFDANPTLLPGGKPSAFGGMEGAFAAGREAGDNKGGVVCEFKGVVGKVEFASAIRNVRPRRPGVSFAIVSAEAKRMFARTVIRRGPPMGERRCTDPLC